MVKLGSDSVGALVRSYAKGPLGLSFLMAWIYGTFYSSMVWSGENVAISELPWIASMLLSGLLGLVGFFACRRRSAVMLESRRWLPIVAALLCAFGMVLVGLCRRYEVASPLVIVLCVIPVAGGFSLLTVLWGSRVSRYDEAMIEFSVPMSFIIARIIYAALGLLDPFASFAVMVALPFVSAAFLRFRSSSSEDLERVRATSSMQTGGSISTIRPFSETRGIVAATAMLMVFRFGYGVIRIAADGPAAQGWWYVLLMLFVPVTVFGVFVVLALTSARSITSSLVTRWTLPVLLLAFALVPVDASVGHLWSRLSNSVVSIVLQAFFWILLAKVAHRHPGSAPFFFSCYLIGLGLGMAFGECCGLLAASLLGETLAQLSLPFVAAAVVAVVMALEERSRSFGVEGDVRTTSESRAGQLAEDGVVDALDAMLSDQARRMAVSYKLSPREEEIVAYLLAGRNRPYIRDTLFISLNTVNTHIKNAFAKMDIHSQQELLDIARAEFPTRLPERSSSHPNWRAKRIR